MPASCPAQTCDVPVYLMTSFFRTETIILPIILRKTLSTPVGQSPGFLSNDINRQDKKVFIV